MTAVVDRIREFVASEDGATAIEYGLIAALVAIGALVALTTMGGSVTSLFQSVADRAAAELDNIEGL